MWNSDETTEIVRQKVLFPKDKRLCLCAERPAQSWKIDLLTKPFSTWILFRFHLSNRYYHQDLHWWYRSGRSHPKMIASLPLRTITTSLLLKKDNEKSFQSPSCFLYRPTEKATSLERHPLSRYINSAGELLHTPWPMTTSMATVQLSRLKYALWGISERKACRPNKKYGWSRITRPAYQAWATWSSFHSKISEISHHKNDKSEPETLRKLGVWLQSKGVMPPRTAVSLSTSNATVDLKVADDQRSCGTFRRKPATR